MTGPVALGFLALVALLIVGLTPLFQALLHLPFLLRVGVIVLAMAPPGILMGMFFPSGLCSVGRRRPGSSLGVGHQWLHVSLWQCRSYPAAMVYGFNVVLTLGAAVYAFGFLAARWFSREEMAWQHP